MKTNVTTIYLADDHQIVIDGLQLLINNELELMIIGTAIDGNTAYNEILIKRPDIALIDYRMPGMNGIELINELKKIVQTRFIILSMHNDKRYIADALNYGASGYLLKNTGKNELINCINAVMNGERYFSDDLNIKKNEKDAVFTPRELEILRLITNEFTTQQIAAILHLSHYTIETHRKNICRKTNTNTTLGLIKYILENSIEI